ncbi:MAG: Gfo/Idh/MocA family oxidoreductase [Candidatus Latescibacteria bacterium]|nr:Gfo/Idh/MocA family oxidoreductase [Candidatus Latescibacterota bacterium]
MNLKVGIAGLRRGHSFYNVFRPRKDSEVVAVCDSVEERTEAFAREHHIPKAYTEYEEFLKEDLDAVVVAKRRFRFTRNTSSPPWRAENTCSAKSRRAIP